MLFFVSCLRWLQRKLSVKLSVIWSQSHLSRQDARAPRRSLGRACKQMVRTDTPPCVSSNSWNPCSQFCYHFPQRDHTQLRPRTVNWPRWSGFVSTPSTMHIPWSTQEPSLSFTHGIISSSLQKIVCPSLPAPSPPYLISCWGKLGRRAQPLKKLLLSALFFGSSLNNSG